MSAAGMPVRDWHFSAYDDFVKGKEWLGLTGVLLAHLALFAAMAFLGSREADPVVTPPAIMGVLVPATPPDEAVPPKPTPPVSKPHEPKPIARPKPIAPPVKAPPSERAIETPRTEEKAAREEAKQAAADVSPSSQPAQTTSQTPTPAPVIPPRTDASQLNNPAPNYPSLSRRSGEQGQVLLDVFILPDGSVGEIRLKRSSGFSRLDEAALRAVRQWRYIPARRGNEPIAYWYVQPIRFALDN